MHTDIAQQNNTPPGAVPDAENNIMTVTIRIRLTFSLTVTEDDDDMSSMDATTVIATASPIPSARLRENVVIPQHFGPLARLIREKRAPRYRLNFE